MSIVLDVLMFPMKVLKYSFRGVSFIYNSLVAPDKLGVFNPDRLEGETLDAELERVKAQSNEFSKKQEEAQLKESTAAKKIQFKYEVRDDYDNVIKGKIDSPSAKDAVNFLKTQFDEVISIEELGVGSMEINLFGKSISIGVLSFALTQLSTYIKAGIPLIDAMRILTRQTSNQTHKKIFQQVVYQLYLGESFSSALEKQDGAFPTFLISMVKTAEMTGDLASTLDEMSEYFTKTEKSRKQMKSALIYPAVIFTVAVFAIFFLILFVVPQFVDLFASNNAELPAITQFVLNSSNFLQSYWWVILLVAFIVILAFYLAFKNIREFRKNVQTFAMHLPIFGNIIIYNEVTNLTRTFSSLVDHGVFITDSMEILSNITTNEVYKEIINRTLIGLSKGAKISETFRGEWAFPIVAYEMLVTGESTGQLALMMEKVADHFANLHETAVNTLKSLLEPIIIVFLSVIVGFILISIIMPMFELYNQL